ncbi:MAG: methionine--tRNA ligase [Deltaproteobacteria bacterium]
MNVFYITTPIFYVNAQPHLGHAYTAIIADVASRFQRLCGKETFFQTGTDEHGDKIAQAAAESKVSPRQYADRISAMFRAAWPPLQVRPDNFIRTTDQAHVKVVQDILQKVHDQGDIYFSEYTGLYCKGCERFLTEKELVEGHCPDHQKPPEQISEQNYFFRMSRYQQWLIDHIEKNPEFISPERYRNEVLAFLKEPLEDLCISRPTSRLTWGIPLPFDQNYVTYVWFDALINYLTGIGYPEGENFLKFWPVAEHIIAKDILKPHAIYWPTMLQAMGVAPYRKLHVHGYWNINETKMSKSIGNVVRPEPLVKQFGADAVRYFLLREMSFGLDASFSEEAIIGRQNADLANDLGNLFSRSLAMVSKFTKNRIPQPHTANDLDRELKEAAGTMLVEYKRQMEEFSFNRALQTVWEVISRANKYIVANEPWVLAKDPAKADRLATMLYHLLETLRLIALTLGPIMPETAEKMSTVLQCGYLTSLERDGRWGLLPSGMELGQAAPLFPRYEKKKDDHSRGALQGKSDKGGTEQDNLLDFEAFQKIDLRVAQVIAAERVPKSDRLLKLTVKAPDERTIVAGIAQHYPPEEMVGRQVIIVANLKPAKLMGITSEGMVLAAKDGNKLVLPGLSDPIAPGSRIS